ncbi:hypothetical protein T08_2302 [Trichinella sp. T8]|nr:hypothetical protein T08_2302 [Trichinella sp. T8]
MVHGPLSRIGSTSGESTNVQMDQVVKSAHEAAGALERELLQEFPWWKAADKYRGELQCANMMREQVGAADEWLRQKCQVSTVFPGCHTVASWENNEKEGQRRLEQITAAMESTDFTVALKRTRLILKIQRAEKTAEALRRWCDDSQLSRESHIRLGLTKGIKKHMSRDLVQNNNMVSSGKKELPICAEPLSTTSNVVLQREQHETLGASTHKPFDLMKDGGDFISAILGQKAEDQVPNFRGGAAEYPSWEEAIAPICYSSFQQPIMKFNAIKKSLSGKALEVVKRIGLDQPDPFEMLVDGLKKEYGRPVIVIRAQEVRLEKLASLKEDDYLTLRNFVIAVKSIIATMKAHGYDVEKNPQFTRQLERKLDGVLDNVHHKWSRQRKEHLLEWETLRRSHHYNDLLVLRQRQEVRQGELSAPSAEKSSVGKMCKVYLTVRWCPFCRSKKYKGNKTCPIPANEQQCPEDRSCRYCHPPLLHHQRRTKEEESSASDQMEKSYICNDSAHHLELLKVFLRGPRKIILTTALIHSGCSRSFVCEDLELKVKLAAMILQGFHAAKNVEAARVSLDIAGLTREWYNVSNATTLKKLRIPGGEVKWADWAKDQPNFAKLPLETVSYADFRILLRQDVKELTENVCTTKVKSDDKKYVAYRCKVGWTISGLRLPSHKEVVMYCCIINDEVDHGTALLQKFRNSLEGLGITYKSLGLSRREMEDLEHMQNGTVVLSDGRFQSPMLWKWPGGVPPSEEQVKRRLISLQKKLRLNPRLGELYEKGIQDDETKGYIRRLSPMEAADLRKRHHWLLPHFPVFHPGKADKCGRIAVNADVKEMYSQVAVAPADSDMLAFLWISSVDREPDVYLNQRHVFSATCSEAFQMDDVYWSDDNEDVVIQRSQELTTAFRKACFELSKWVSNSRKALDIAWDCEQDSLTFACRRQGEKAKTVSDVFNPAGSSRVKSAAFRRMGSKVATVGKRYEDGSHGVNSKMGGTAFVAAKSRVVNPLKTTTVPRLELQAFIVGVSLANTLLKELENRLVIGRVVFWSDSLMVLYWINSDENRYLPFVSNRLRETNETLQSCRFKDPHVYVINVPSKENLADMISRGLGATGLIKRFVFWTTGR